METKITPAKSSANYGIIFGIIMILEFVIMYALNINAQEVPIVGVLMNVTNYLILPFLLIYLGAENYKKNFNSGFISFGETVKIGLSICVLAALFYGVFYLLFDFIFPEFKMELLDQIKRITVKQNPSMTSEQIKMSMKFVEIFMNPYVIVPFTIAMYAVIGLIHSLIVGAIVKKEKPAF